MTDTTVQEFADVVGTDSDRLLTQMKEDVIQKLK